MSLLTGKNTPNFAKATVYHFMKMVQINWMRFTTILASRIINNAILPLDSEDRANFLIIDDSMFERNRSEKIELLAKVYDHAKHKYRFGFRMLTLVFFRYDGEDMSLISIYNKNKKRRGRSKYLLSVMVDVVKDGDIIPAKVVYVRNRNKRKEYLCLISTDVNLDENEIIRIYGKRWDIEVYENTTAGCIKAEH